MPPTRPAATIQIRARIAASQDAVVELAVDRIYAEMRERDEAALWSGAAEDPAFQEEMSAIAADFGDKDAWPR